MIAVSCESQFEYGRPWYTYSTGSEAAELDGRGGLGYGLFTTLALRLLPQVNVAAVSEYVARIGSSGITTEIARPNAGMLNVQT